jgi:energy-coupling factor transporter transmembrane protein EcfT
METKNVIIVCIWLFVIVVFVGYLWVGEILTFFGVIALFIIAAISTAVAAFGLPAVEHELEVELRKPELERRNELQAITSKLDKLADEVSEIKKAIEE